MVTSQFIKDREVCQNIKTSEDLENAVRDHFNPAFLNLYHNAITTNQMQYSGKTLHVLFLRLNKASLYIGESTADELYLLIETYCLNVLKNSEFSETRSYTGIDELDFDVAYFPILVAMCPVNQLAELTTYGMRVEFIRSIYDVYVPSESGGMQVSPITDTLPAVMSGEVGLTPLLKFATDQFYDLDEVGMQECRTEITLWYKYATAVCTDRIARKEFCKKYFICVLYKDMVVSGYGEMESLFGKYLGEDESTILASSLNWAFHDYIDAFDANPNNARAEDICVFRILQLIIDLNTALPREMSREERMKIIPLFVNATLNKITNPHLVATRVNTRWCAGATTPLVAVANRVLRDFNLDTIVTAAEKFRDNLFGKTFEVDEVTHIDRAISIGDTTPYSADLERFDEIVTEAAKNISGTVDKATNNIYKGFKAYKNSEAKIDSQISKMCVSAKKLLIGDTRTEIIEGKKFSAIGILKKVLGTAAVFSFSKIGGVITLVVRYALKKKTTISERKRIILELEEELKILDEKIEDARGDGNRQAKYNLIRTRSELEKGLNQVKFGLVTDERSIQTAKNFMNGRRTRNGTTE